MTFRALGLSLSFIATALPALGETPDILRPLPPQGPVVTAADWEARRPLLRERFQTEVYGRLPTGPRSHSVISQRIVDERAFGNRATLEETEVHYAPLNVTLRMAYVVPKTEGPHPVVIVTAFCGNAAQFGNAELKAPVAGIPEFCARFASAPLQATNDPDPYLFAPPIETLLDKGYAVVSFSTSDIVPDDKITAITALKALSPTNKPDEQLGAIGAWGLGYSLVIDFLESDNRFDPTAQAIYGHSRNGKAAIMAAAFDERIDLVFAHQSGRGGAALSRSPVGEQVHNITGGFPHWFAPNYAHYGDDPNRLPVDQHDLLGLIAPRPILLGAGVDDQWADPEGAWQAATAATPVYQLLGRKGLTQVSRETLDLQADIAYFLREGRHGTTKSDWDRFIAFMNVHFER